MGIRDLPVELKQKAEEELNEDCDRLQNGLNSLREWLKFQKHLHFKDDSQFLVAFLRGCKYRIETAKKKLDFYYTSRTLTPEFFKDRSPYNKPIQTILENNTVSFYVPKLTFPTICYVAWSKVEQNNISMEEIIQHYFMGTDLLINEEDAFVINGLIIILDLKDVSLKYLLQCPIGTMKKYFLLIQNACPIRIKGICAINAPSYLHTIYKILEVTFSEKLKQRIHIHSEENLHKMYDVIPQPLLPDEFGGKAGSVKELAGAWRKRLESYNEWFKEEDKYKSNEELRVGQPKTYAEVFGIEGSFRQLSFD